MLDVKVMNLFVKRIAPLLLIELYGKTLNQAVIPWKKSQARSSLRQEFGDGKNSQKVFINLEKVAERG
jgi:hypothetical protein